MTQHRTHRATGTRGWIEIIGLIAVVDAHGRWLRDEAHGQRAYLTRANLRYANLAGADLARAKREGTGLDPSAPIPAIADWCGLEVRGGYVYGWRTRVSSFVGAQRYEPGQTYEAPVFSVCTAPCHPGIYLASSAWLDANGYAKDRVRVRARVEDVHRAGDKFRARRIEVLADRGVT